MPRAGGRRRRGLTWKDHRRSGISTFAFGGSASIIGTGHVGIAGIVDVGIDKVYNLLNGADLSDINGVIETAIDKTFALLDGAL